MHHSQRAAQATFCSVEHLGPEAVAAYVDDELSPSARQRAVRHLGLCPECRREVNTQRRAAASLRTAEEVYVPGHLLERLVDLATSCPPDSSPMKAGDQPPRRLLDKMDHLYRTARKLSQG